MKICFGKIKMNMFKKKKVLCLNYKLLIKQIYNSFLIMLINVFYMVKKIMANHNFRNN